MNLPCNWGQIPMEAKKPYHFRKPSTWKQTEIDELSHGFRDLDGLLDKGALCSAISEAEMKQI